MKEQIYTVKENQYGTFWYKDPECEILHRLKGPAIEKFNGYKEYLVNGKRHREDGPAVEYTDGARSYWLEGFPYGKQEYWNKVNKNSCSNKIVEIDGKRYKLVEL